MEGNCKNVVELTDPSALMQWTRSYSRIGENERNSIGGQPPVGFDLRSMTQMDFRHEVNLHQPLYN